MIGARNLKTKKVLKEMKGKSIAGHFVETSMFGNEMPSDGTGRITMVGPDAYRKRSWFATVTLEDFIITKVT